MTYVKLRLELSDEVYYPLLSRATRKGISVEEIATEILIRGFSDETEDSDDKIQT